MKTAIIIGCSANVWDDVKAAKALSSYDAIYCVKQMGLHYPEAFNVWVTLHPEAMDEYEIQRHKLDLPNGYQIVAPPPNELGSHAAKGNINRRVSYTWNKESSASASSGIYGAKVAIEDGFDKIVLAGIPMTSEGGHFLPEGKMVSGQRRGVVWSGCAAFEIGFDFAIPYLMGKVKSMSGRTQKVFGAPSAEWFNKEK